MSMFRWFDNWIITHAPSLPPEPIEPQPVDSHIHALWSALNDDEKRLLYARLEDVENTIRMYEAKANLRRRAHRES